jgi:hypothetical protein
MISGLKSPLRWVGICATRLIEYQKIDLRENNLTMAEMAIVINVPVGGRGEYDMG